MGFFRILRAIAALLVLIAKNFATHYRKSKSFRSSRFQMFFQIGVLKDFAMLTIEHLCWSHLFMKLQAWSPAILLEKESNTGVFL